MHKMHKPSLIQRIESYAKKNPFWISGGTYERLALEAGYKASNCSRRLRELCVGGILERREVKGHVEYRWRSPEQIIANMEATLKAKGVKKQMGFPDYVEVESHQSALI